jgi:hypothetical protein
MWLELSPLKPTIHRALPEWAGIAACCRQIIGAEGEGDYFDLIEALVWAADYTNGSAKLGDKYEHWRH